MATIEELRSEQSRRAQQQTTQQMRGLSASDIQTEIAKRQQQAKTQETERQRLATELAAKQGPFSTAAIAAGRGLTTIGRAVGLAEPEDPATTRAFQALQEQRPITTTVGEVVGEAAPFLVPGTALGAVASLPLRVLGGATLGASEGTAITRGKGRDEQAQAQAAGIGGVIGGAAEALFPVIGRIGGALIRRVTGEAPQGALLDASGIPTPELQDALQKAGTTFDDLSQDAQKLLDASAGADPQQAARKAFLESQGVAPTRAQITRDAGTFQAQQEAAKTSGRVREALEAQDAILTTRFNQAVLETGGLADTPTSTIADALVGKATGLDQEISNLYKQARELAPTEKGVKFNRLGSKLKELAPSNRATGGAVEAIVGDLKAKGVLDDDLKVVGRVDVQTAEDTRKLMNELFDPQNGFRNGVLRQLKDTLDDDVFLAAGVDVFKQGRKAKSDFEKELSRAKISKFDSRKANLVRDVLENKISPDTFTNDVVFSKKWRGDDLKQLKDYISTTQDGGIAFDDLRADTLNKIKEGAFIGPADAEGFQSLSRAKLESQLNKIGNQKLDVLFTPKERKFLDDMLKVSKLREPVRGTALGRGPTAQAVGRLEKKLANLPIIGGLVDFINIDAQGRVALKSKPAQVPVEPSRLAREIPGLAAPAGIAATISTTEGQQ